MDFANESYVRLYTRDTMTWKRFNWQAKAVMPLLLRKLDRSGVLELAGLEPAEAVALATELPIEVVAEAMPVLLKLGVVEVNEGVLVEPRFIEAQECTKSDALRAKEYRERRRSQAMGRPSQNVTHESRGVTGPSREITERHAASRSVTLNSLNSADLNSAEQSREHARALAHDIKVGRRWFIEAVLSGDDTQAPDVERWRSDYAKLGRKSAAERAAVAKHIQADTWLRENRKALDPGHCVKYWQKYAAGGLKTVETPRGSREQAEADQKAAAASKLVQLRAEYAARIQAARDRGDVYDAEVLAAERDGRLARLQTQAS